MHLNLLEHGAYMMLLQKYYLDETPLPLNLSELCRKCMARTDEEKAAVEFILSEFFTETDSGWIHVRCQAEIEAYQRKVQVASESGKKGGRPRKEAAASSQKAKPKAVENKVSETAVEVEEVETVEDEVVEDFAEPSPVVVSAPEVIDALDESLPTVIAADAPFPMFIGWQPKDKNTLNFILRQCRYPNADSDEFAAVLIEFSQYWANQKIELKESEWVHKLTQKIQGEKVRSAGIAKSEPSERSAASPVANQLSKSEQAFKSLERMKQDKASNPIPNGLPANIFAELVTGIQKLVALSLDGRPPADTIQATVLTWESVIFSTMKTAWDSKLDAGRIEKAFDKILPKVKRFPAPEEIIALMPIREISFTRIRHQKTEEELQKDKELMADNRERLKAVAANIRNGGKKNE